ncbi:MULTISPECIES: L-rhamnose mutarotase [Microbacterium]|uniref:L-rhamnose mutarotase n=1 Tax=Microbacterium TaxID=33882 RepID=UPI001E4DD67D|nr:L-rhamnose mutarotase [Microbacterium nymphoidis]MCD2498137.1 L-rhamnose mutarotase [Microbacterium nymphoidis]
MTAFCYVFELLPGVDDEYDRRHAELSPLVVDAMHAAGIDDFRLFRRDRLVIAVGSADRPVPEVFAALERDPANREWSDSIRRLMSRATDETGSLLFADEIWRLPGKDSA